tara:strand:- start:7782 stop:8309 length:528 start_codon:yes stop_codon:yes gene_type:complete
MPPVNPIPIITTFLALFGAKKSYDTAQDAAQKEREAGELQARQYVSELFAAQTEANQRMRRRLEDQKIAESQNIAFFNMLGRTDRSVDAYMKRNRDIVQEDVRTIESQLELTKANLQTQASVSYKYGQNVAAGMRSVATTNLLSNMYDLSTSADFRNLFATSDSQSNTALTNKEN